MTTRPAVLIDERDRRLGRLMVSESCFIIAYAERVFVRTGRAVRLHHSHNATAVVFEETEVYHRRTLDPI